MYLPTGKFNIYIVVNAYKFLCAWNVSDFKFLIWKCVGTHDDVDRHDDDDAGRKGNFKLVGGEKGDEDTK